MDETSSTINTPIPSRLTPTLTLSSPFSHSVSTTATKASQLEDKRHLLHKAGRSPVILEAMELLPSKKSFDCHACPNNTMPVVDCCPQLTEMATSFQSCSPHPVTPSPNSSSTRCCDSITTTYNNNGSDNAFGAERGNNVRSCGWKISNVTTGNINKEGWMRTPSLRSRKVGPGTVERVHHSSGGRDADWGSSASISLEG